jgi:hypothetical protein
MKKSLLHFAGLASLTVLSLGTAGATTLYQNTTGDLSAEFYDGQTEYGNEIVLAGGSSFTITNFAFEYYGLNFTGGEQADVRIYENNGALFETYATPGTLLYDSGNFTVTQTGTPGATINFDDPTLLAYNGNPINVTNDITFTVQFSNVGATNAGVDLYYPPTVGTNFGDMWVNTTNGWQLEFNTNVSLGIGAEVQGTAVPEPTAVMLGLMGGVAGLMMVFRNRRG